MSTAQLSDQQVRELGVKLKSAREGQSRDLADAAFRIALSPSQLRALEAGDRRPFYSTHYFLQAVERYGAFLGVTLPELAGYRAQVSSAATHDATPDPTNLQGHENSDPIETTGWPAKERAANAPMPPVTLPQGRKAVHGKSQSLSRLIVVGAAVITIAVVVTLQDSAPPPAPKAALEPPVTTPADTAPPATAIAPKAQETSASPASPAPPSVSERDGVIQSTVNAWVQIVSKSGEKSNLRIAAGESVGFVADETAAVVIGQPEKATLTLRGKAVDLRQHTANKEGSPRALIIIGDVLR